MKLKKYEPYKSCTIPRPKKHVKIQTLEMPS